MRRKHWRSACRLPRRRIGCWRWRTRTGAPAGRPACRQCPRYAARYFQRSQGPGAPHFMGLRFWSCAGRVRRDGRIWGPGVRQLPRTAACCVALCGAAGPRPATWRCLRLSAAGRTGHNDLPVPAAAAAGSSRPGCCSHAGHSRLQPARSVSRACAAVTPLGPSLASHNLLEGTRTRLRIGVHSSREQRL